MGSFLEDSFVAPMREGTGYTIPTTILVAVLLAAFSFLAMKTGYFRKTKVSEIFKDILPFVLLGAVSRSLEDGCFLPCSWPIRLIFITPGIWILSFALFFLAGGLFSGKARILGWLLFAPVGIFALLKISNFLGLSLVLGLAVLSSLVLLKVLLPLLKRKLSPEAKAILLAHVFDASSTFVAVSYFGYFEEHVFARFLMSIGGPALFFIVKIAGISALVLFSESYKGFSENEKKILYVAMLLVGLGPGIRNTASVSIGV